MKKFKNLEELDARLSLYKNSTNNDYMNRYRYLENFEDLYYYDHGDLYLGVKVGDYWKVTYYLQAHRPLKEKMSFFTEVVGRHPDTEAIEAVGFRPYRMRLRLRLKDALPYVSHRVTFVEDVEFVAKGISSFDPISGNRQTMEAIQKEVKNKRVIGIEGAGFLQFSVGPIEQSIEHLYVKEAYRGKGLAREMLMHYAGNCIEKKRATVWTDVGGLAEGLYEKAGFKKDGFHSSVLVYSPKGSELK